MSRRKILQARHGLLWKRGSCHGPGKAHKGRERKNKPFDRRVSCLSYGYHSYLFEILQVKCLLAAHDPRTLPPQLPLHRRRDIDCGQGLVEDLAGKLFQVRHRQDGPSSFTLSVLRDSECSRDAAPRKSRPRFPPPCTPSLFASPAKPRPCAAPAPRSDDSSQDEAPALFQTRPTPRPRSFRFPGPRPALPHPPPALARC